MPNVDRRSFLKLVGAGGVGAGAGFMLAESAKHPVENLVPYPVPPEEFSTGIATWYNSVCSMCSAGCGISVRTREGRAKKIEGNPAHPVSQGRLCALGQAGLNALYNPDRLIEPLVRTGARGTLAYDPTTWDDGLAELAGRVDLLRAAGRGNRVAFLSNGVRGHLANLLEQFMAEIGSERLLHYDFDYSHSLAAANEKFFGQATLPYYDIGNARYLLSFGADYLGRWLSPVHHSIGFGRSRQGRENVRGHFVQIEPRMSLSGAAADEWVPANPGTEGMLALGLAQRIVAQGGYAGADRDAWSDALAAYTPDSVAEQTGVPAETIRRLADAFADSQPGLAIGGGAAGHQSNGVDALVAVNALNYLVGNIGVEGGLILNPPPAFGPTESRQASYSTMLELGEAAAQGDIEVLIVNNTNPVFNLPAASGFEEALAEIPLIVSLSSFLDETTALADLILPSHTYLESWGDDTPEPGVGFRVGAVSQPVVSPLYNTRATGDIILSLTQRMDVAIAFPWADSEAYLKAGWREIYLRGEPLGTTEGFESFWTDVVRAGVWGDETRADQTAFTVDASLISAGVATPEFDGADGEYPYLLHPYLSTSLHDGRGANLPWLQELPDPLTGVVYNSWAELNPVTAETLGLSEGDVVTVQSQYGSIDVPVFVYPAIMPNVIAIPLGQGHTQYGRYARDRGVNPMRIVAPQTEPATGALAWGATRVLLTPTGRHVELTRVSGESRELGREIVQIASVGDGANSNARLNSIPITVVQA